MELMRRKFGKKYANATEAIATLFTGKKAAKDIAGRVKKKARKLAERLCPAC